MRINDGSARRANAGVNARPLASPWASVTAVVVLAIASFRLATVMIFIFLPSRAFSVFALHPCFGYNSLKDAKEPPYE
jgi:hypothetical protein